MKTFKLLTCALASSAAFTAAVASGQNLTATLVDSGPSLLVNGTVDNGSFTQAYPSGVLRFTEFNAFCVEPTQGIAYGETLVYQIQDPASLVINDKIARLVGGYLASSGSAANAAAVQWAIWETTTETLSGPSLLDGNVRISIPVNQDIALLGNFYLANLDKFAPASVTFLSNPDRQDVVTWNAVPEPGSAVLCAVSALALLRRRRR